MEQFSWSMPIQGNKRLRENPSDDQTSLSNFWKVSWVESMAPKHLSVCDCRSTQSPEFSVILKLKLNGEDGDNMEANKRRKLGTDTIELAQGLYKNDPTYQGDNMETVNSSCDFSLSDIDALEGDLELYEEDGMGEFFLEHGWEASKSIADMDKLFQLEELLWPPPPYGHVYSLSNMDIGHPSPDLFIECSEGSEGNMELISSGNFSPIPFLTTMDCDSKLWDNGNLVNFPEKSGLEHSQGEITAAECLKERKLDRNQAGSQSMEHHSTVSGLDLDVTREFESKPNKQHYEKSVAPGSQVSAKAEIAMKIQSPFLSSGKDFSSPILPTLPGSFNTKGEMESLERSPQPILYVQMGHEHSVPNVMSKCTPTSDPPQQSGHNHRYHFRDLSMQQNHDTVHIPFCSYMAPGEKEGKLYCHQNMQNKTAKKQHSYQSSNQQWIHVQEKYISNQGEEKPEDIVNFPSLISENPNSELQPSTGTLASKIESSPACQEYISLDATVLWQLQSSISDISVNTRLCIRDALYRLARSARQRCTLAMSRYNKVTSTELYDDGAYGTESSDSNRILSNQRLLELNEIEAETNQFDRAIANLLFQKCQAPSIENPGSMGIPLLTPTNGIHPFHDALKAPNSFSWQGRTPSQTGMLILPSSTETVLKDEYPGLSPLSMQFQNNNSRSVIDNHAANSTPSSFRNKKLRSIAPQAPSEHFILSLDNFDDVVTEVRKNCHPLPCLYSLSNTDTSVRYQKSDKTPDVMKDDKVSEDVVLLDNAMKKMDHLEPLSLQIMYSNVIMAQSGL